MIDNDDEDDDNRHTKTIQKRGKSAQETLQDTAEHFETLRNTLKQVSKSSKVTPKALQRRLESPK